MFLKSDVLDRDDVFHGFFDKRGREAAYLEERKIPLYTLKQIHSPLCHAVEGHFDCVLQGDSLVTDLPGMALGVYTADCTPVLFTGEKRDGSPVIGAAHAGWRGAYSGILDNTIASLVWHGAKEDSIKAVLGPTIAQESYEVSQEFFDSFIAQSDANHLFFKSSKNEGHYMFDLPGYVIHRLMNCGVSEIGNVHMDTYTNEMDYNSYRRATHTNGEKGLRQTSVIYIESK